MIRMPTMSWRRRLMVLVMLFVFWQVLRGVGTETAKVPIAEAQVSQARHIELPKRLSIVLLGYIRVDSLQKVVASLQRYSGIVVDMVIWNNNVERPLTHDDFGGSLAIPLRIINSRENKYFEARYSACLMSGGDYCYFQDDDWRNDWLHSMYANFLKSPHLLHTITNDFVHYLSWSWTFFNEEVNMHSGFSWVGTGAIADKQAVIRFMEQLRLLEDSVALLADMYFSTWMNQVPYQLETPLVELEDRFGFSSETGGIARNELHMSKAAEILYTHLKNGDPKFTTAHLTPRWEQRDARAPCHNDECLFLTNVNAFPSPAHLVYSPGDNITVVQTRAFATCSYSAFQAHPYHAAVDSSPTTSWQSTPGLSAGDYFGIDLLAPDACRFIHVMSGHVFQSNLKLEVRDETDFWNAAECRWVPTETGYEMVGEADKCRYRYVRFVLTDARPKEYFEVFDIRVSGCRSA